MTHRIYLDVDGVLADFAGAALAAHGKPRADRNTLASWDIAGHCGVSEDSFWAPLESSHFWQSLDLLPQAHDVVRYCEGFAGPEGVCLLTSPRLCGGAYAGRLNWIRHHFPRFLHRHLMGPAKQFAAGQGFVLIDDNEPNVEAFRRAGGWAILYPAPWNSRRDLHSRAAETLAGDFRRLELVTAYHND